MTRAAIYVRISKDSEASGLGVQRQRKHCRALAKKLGWEVEGVYEDNDTSASSGVVRKDYRKMVRAVEAGKVQAIVVWAVDRLTRTPRELEDAIDWADKYGLELASVGGPVDLATPQGRFAARSLGTAARYEVEQAGRRVRRKHAELAEAGLHSGPRPFGWQVDPDHRGRLILDKGEAAVVRECAERVLAGDSLWAICNDLNAAGVTTTRGNPWRTQVLRRMLLRWANVKVREHQQVKMVDGKQVKVGAPTYHEAAWEPILDREVYDRLRAKLTDPARRSNNRGTEPKYLLTSYGLCGKCGEHVVGACEARAKLRDGRTRVYPARYRCPHAGCHGVVRPMAQVDRVVEKFVVALLERDGVRLLGGDAKQAQAAREEIAALEAKLAVVADQYATDAITAEQLSRITATVRPRLEEARARLARSMPPEGDLSEFETGRVSQAWSACDVTRKKRIMRTLGMQVTLHSVGTGRGGGPFDPASVEISMVRD